MGNEHELQEIKDKIDDLNQDIKGLNKDVNQLVPMLKNCLEEIGGINTEQRFIRTILQRHDTTMEFHAHDLQAVGADLKEQRRDLYSVQGEVNRHTKDLANIGTQVDELQINQIIYKTASSAAAGEAVKWTIFVEFLNVLLKHWKSIGAVLLSLISLLTMALKLSHR